MPYPTTLNDYGQGASSLRWDDLRVPITSVRLGGVADPDFVIWRKNQAGSSTGVGCFAFSGTSVEQVYFQAQLPHGYAEGTTIEPHVHFTTTAAPVAGQTVKFGLEYTYGSVGDLFPVTETIYATKTFSASDAAYQQHILGFDPGITDPDMTISAMFSCRLFRDATNDTYAPDALILEFDIHYQMDAAGSLNKLYKADLPQT